MLGRLQLSNQRACHFSRSGLASPSPRCISSRHLHLRQVGGGPCPRRQQQQQQQQQAPQPRPSTQCRATLDDPELAELVARMQKEAPPSAEQRERLERCLRLIDEANASDPSKVSLKQGDPKRPRRVVFAEELSRWVKQLDPHASDELLILARGKDVRSWELSKLKRDDYSPSWAGMRQWERERKQWQAAQLAAIVKEAGYDDAMVKSISDVLLSKDVPDPRNMRRHDLVGPLGIINYRLLRMAEMMQTLKDAEALVFLEKSFAAMQTSGMPAEEVQQMLKRELSQVSLKCYLKALEMEWTPVQEKMLRNSFRSPTRFFDVQKNLENAASASLHPGDWRFKDFDYE